MYVSGVEAASVKNVDWKCIYLSTPKYATTDVIFVRKGIIICQIHRSSTFLIWIPHFRFKSAYTLKAHKIMHQDEKKFKCELCDNAYKRKSSLQIHLAVHAAKINKRFPCDLCTETFLHRSEMVVHRSTHTGDRVYKYYSTKFKFFYVFLPIFAYNLVLFYHSLRCDMCNYATRHRGDIGAHKRTLIHLEALKKLSEAQQ